MSSTYTAIEYDLSEAERSQRFVTARFVLDDKLGATDANLKYTPPRSFYGYATYFIGDTVVDYVELMFPKQTIFSWESVEMQNIAWLSDLSTDIANDVKNAIGVLNPSIVLGLITLQTITATPALACPYSKIIATLSPVIVGHIEVSGIPVALTQQSSVNFTFP